MKIRTAFVSNSSSSSFLISLFGDQGDQDELLGKAMRVVIESNDKKDLRFPTVKEVTREFLRAQIKDYKKGPSLYDLVQSKEEALKRLLEVPDDLDYTVFKACNYDCEIYKERFGQIVVFTCNNENNTWDEALCNITKKYPHIKIIRWGEDLPERYHNDSNKYYRYHKKTKKEEKKKLYLGSYWNYIKMKKDGKKIVILEAPAEEDIKFAEEFI